MTTNASRVHKADDINRMSEAEVWALPHGPHSIIFNDDAIETVYDGVVIAWYLWDLIRQYPKVKLVSSFFPNVPVITNESLQDVNSKMVETILHVYWHETNMERVTYTLAMSFNKLHNAMVKNLGPYICSPTITDYIDIQKESSVKEAIEILNNDPSYLEKAYEIADKAIKTSPELKNNNLVMSYANGSFKRNQFLQNTIARGWCSETDGFIFKKPIVKSYVDGITDLGDMLIDSRGAAIAATSLENPLKKSEHLSRRLQLLGMSITTLHSNDDCGSTRYAEKTIGYKELKTFRGVWYVTENKTLKPLKSTDTHLLGKTIKYRAMFYCQHPDPQGVCAVCASQVSHSVPNHESKSNFGWVCGSTACKDNSQNLMSTKHYLGSASEGGIYISDGDRQFFKTNKGTSKLWLQGSLKTKSVKIALKRKECYGLVDNFDSDNEEDTNGEDVGRLSSILLSYTEDDNEYSFVIDLMLGKRSPHMTLELMSHINGTGWDIGKKRNIEIDLSTWDFNLPIFEYPSQSVSPAEFTEELEKILFTKTINPKGYPKSAVIDNCVLAPLCSYPDPEEAFNALYKLASVMLNTHVMHWQLVILAMCCRDPDNRDYGIGKYPGQRKLVCVDDAVLNRSASAAALYQDISSVMIEPAAFLSINKPSHPTDVFFKIGQPDTTGC